MTKARGPTPSAALSMIRDLKQQRLLPICHKNVVRRHETDMTDIADMTDMRFTFKMAIHGHPKNMELPLSALRHQMRRIG
jgi:hypothetical protein